MNRKTSSALALLPAFLLMAGRTTSVLAQTQTVGSGSYNSPPSAPLLQGTGSPGNSPGYDAWSTTGRSGGTGGQGPSITQTVTGSFNSQAGSKAVGGVGGNGGASVGSGGPGGQGGSPGNVRVTVARGGSISVNTNSNSSIAGVRHQPCRAMAVMAQEQA